MTKDEWIKRFVTRMIDRAGRDHFDDGELILDYAYATAPSYWEDGGSDGQEPEECADVDMSYWGEE